MAGAALLGLRLLDAGFSRRIQNYTPRPQARSMPFADEVSYIKLKYERATPRDDFSLQLSVEVRQTRMSIKDLPIQKNWHIPKIASPESLDSSFAQAFPQIGAQFWCRNCVA